MPSAHYQRALAALFARQPARMVPDLDRIRSLSALLDHPEQAFPSLQITGTNGKTSTARMIAALLRALGLTPGTYTSPHLQDVRERIRVRGDIIGEEEFAAHLDYLAPFITEVDARHPDALTFFEILTAVAFVHFADVPVDVGVFEVGMGGRWDATNLVRGTVAVMTRVGLDHAELGSTVEAVAREKSGIIKPGAVVVSAEQPPTAAAVIAAAASAHDAQLVVAGRDFGVESRTLAVGGQSLRLRGATATYDDVYLPLFGEHQARNAACALAAVEAFLGFSGGLDADLVRAGFADVRSPGRFEVLRRAGAATLVLDGAHNPDGMLTLAETLAADFEFRHHVVVLAVLADKDVERILDALVPVAHHLVVTQAPTARTAPAERLAKAAQVRGLTVEIAEDVPDALERAQGVAGGEDAVVVTGSLYTVGAAREALRLAPA